MANPGQVADDLLAQFGLTEAATKRVATYSGGMARRLDIAMSLVGTPEVIFLDEPTTGLDPEGRLEVWRTIKKLAEDGTTILPTTHTSTKQNSSRTISRSCTTGESSQGEHLQN